MKFSVCLDFIVSVRPWTLKRKWLETTDQNHPPPPFSEAIMEAAAAAYGEVIHL